MTVCERASMQILNSKALQRQLHQLSEGYAYLLYMRLFYSRWPLMVLHGNLLVHLLWHFLLVLYVNLLLLVVLGYLLFVMLEYLLFVMLGYLLFMMLWYLLLLLID